MGPRSLDPDWFIPKPTVEEVADQGEQIHQEQKGEVRQPEMATPTTNAPEGRNEKDNTEQNVEIKIDEKEFLPSLNQTETAKQADWITQNMEVEKVS